MAALTAVRALWSPFCNICELMLLVASFVKIVEALVPKKQGQLFCDPEAASGKRGTVPLAASLSHHCWCTTMYLHGPVCRPVHVPCCSWVAMGPVSPCLSSIHYSQAQAPKFVTIKAACGPVPHRNLGCCGGDALVPCRHGQRPLRHQG